MFHIRLKQKRVEAKKTQKELADYLNISPQSVSKWEKGEALPSLEYLPKIAAFLQCDINSFFEEETTATVENDKCITEMVFILDKSGSMAGMETDTIGGFNVMIEKQKEVDGEAVVSTILFSGRIQVLHDRKPLKEVLAITKEDYQVGGNTALLDAIGVAIQHIEDVHNDLRKSNRESELPKRTIFVITTDGRENSSCRYTSEVVKHMIKCKKEIYGWEFLFMAANIDAVETASHIGIGRNRSSNYSVKRSTRTMFEETSITLAGFRNTGHIRDNWAEKIESENK